MALAEGETEEFFQISNAEVKCSSPAVILTMGSDSSSLLYFWVFCFFLKQKVAEWIRYCLLLHSFVFAVLEHMSSITVMSYCECASVSKRQSHPSTFGLPYETGMFCFKIR